MSFLKDVTCWAFGMNDMMIFQEKGVCLFKKKCKKNRVGYIYSESRLENVNKNDETNKSFSGITNS